MEFEEWISWERAEAEISRLIQEKRYTGIYFSLPGDFLSKHIEIDTGQTSNPESGAFLEMSTSRDRLLPAVVYDYSYLFVPSVKVEVEKTDRQDGAAAQKAEEIEHEENIEPSHAKKSKTARTVNTSISKSILASLCEYQKVSYRKPSLTPVKEPVFGNAMIELKDYEECLKEALKRISCGNFENLHIQKDMELHYWNISSRDKKAFPEDASKLLETAERMLNGKLDNSHNPSADLLKSIYHERMSDKKKKSAYQKGLMEIYKEVSKLPYPVCNNKECYRIILDCIRQCITGNHARTVMVLPEYLIRYADTLIASISAEVYSKTVIGIPDRKELMDVNIREEFSMILLTKEEFEQMPVNKALLISDIEHKIEQLSGYIAMEKRLAYGNPKPYKRMQNKLMERLENYTEKTTETEQTFFEQLSADSIYLYHADELLNLDIISRQYCQLGDTKSHETAAKIRMSQKRILSFKKKAFNLQDNFLLYNLLHPDLMDNYQLDNLDVWCSQLE